MNNPSESINLRVGKVGFGSPRCPSDKLDIFGTIFAPPILDGTVTMVKLEVEEETISELILPVQEVVRE